MDETEVKAWLETRVSPRRFLHSMGVYAAAAELAGRYGTDAEPLKLAALIHDCARELGPGELVTLAGEWGIPIREVDRQSPILLHGMVGMEMARRELGIDDRVIISAVNYHTAGHPEMSLSDKLFFMADHIEPARPYPWVKELREAAFKDIDYAVLKAIEINLKYLTANGKTIDPQTLALRERLKSRG
jgi:predicted HD superfamily hydrolase involved in NAD metabolism